MAQIQTQGDVLTASQFAPHLTHRFVVKLAIEENRGIDLNQFEYIRPFAKVVLTPPNPPLIRGGKLPKNRHFPPLIRGG